MSFVNATARMGLVVAAATLWSTTAIAQEDAALADEENAAREVEPSSTDRPMSVETGQSYVVELGAAVTTAASGSGGTNLALGPVLRVGWQQELLTFGPIGLVTGGEVDLLGTWHSKGNPPTKGTQYRFAGAARGLLGANLRTYAVQVMPYGSVSAGADATVHLVEVLGQTNVAMLPSAQVALGGGLLVRTGSFLIRTHVDAGLSGVRPLVSGTLTLGMQF